MTTHSIRVSHLLQHRHAIWWNVEAPSAEGALRLLPSCVAGRTTVVRISEVEIP